MSNSNDPYKAGGVLEEEGTGSSSFSLSCSTDTLLYFDEEYLMVLNRLHIFQLSKICVTPHFAFEQGILFLLCVSDIQL